LLAVKGDFGFDFFQPRFDPGGEGGDFRFKRQNMRRDFLGGVAVAERRPDFASRGVGLGAAS